MSKTLFKKTTLEPLLPEAQWTPAKLSAFGELVPGYREWYRENYDEDGQVRRVREEERKGE